MNSKQFLLIWGTGALSGSLISLGLVLLDIDIGSKGAFIVGTVTTIIAAIIVLNFKWLED